MITLSRQMVRHLRAVFRRSIPGRSALVKPSAVEVISGPGGLRVHFKAGPVTAVYHKPGPLAEGSMAVPLEALAECEGKDDSPVTIRPMDTGLMEVQWTSRGLPQIREYPISAIEPSPNPEMPKSMVPNDPGLLTALHEAMQTASKEATRFILNHILL